MTYAELDLNERSFLQIFGDSIDLAWRSQEEAVKDENFSEKLARMSIISSAIGVECASNCLMTNVDAGAKIADDFDKLGPIAKFQLYAMLNEVEFDRGDSRVQKIEELAKIRNSYVHPKPVKIRVTVDGMKTVGEDVHLDLSMGGKSFNGLNIMEHSKYWKHADAKSTLESCVNFYNWYFVDCLKMDKKHILGTLSPIINLGEENSMVFYQQCVESEISILSNKLKISNQFLDLSCIPKISK